MANPDFGVRMFIILFTKMILHYARHKVNIDENIEPQTRTFLEGLLDVAGSIMDMNVPGPDPNVPSQDSGGL